MASRSDFLLMSCTNTDEPSCSLCSRDMVIPISAVEGFYRDGTQAIISVVTEHFCTNPRCVAHPRFLKTSMLWDDVITLLDGEMTNLGNIEMVYAHKGHT